MAIPKFVNQSATYSLAVLFDILPPDVVVVDIQIANNGFALIVGLFDFLDFPPTVGVFWPG